MLHARTPRALEIHPGELIENIDTPRGQPDLHHRPRCPEVFLCHIKGSKRSTKLFQSSPDEFRILIIQRNPNVEISGRSRDAVNRQSMGPNYEKTRASIQQGAEKI